MCIRDRCSDEDDCEARQWAPDDAESAWEEVAEEEEMVADDVDDHEREAHLGGTFGGSLLDGDDAGDPMTMGWDDEEEDARWLMESPHDW